MRAKVQYSICKSEDFKDLSPWLVAINQIPHQQCLGTWSGQSADEICTQLSGYYDDGELCYISAWLDGNLVGAMGSEFDQSLGRAWLQGPHAIDEDWHGIAAGLYCALEGALPGGLRRMDAYLNVENFRGRDFYKQREFEEAANLSYEFRLLKATADTGRKVDCAALAPEQYASFSQLFTQLFPNAYYSAERLIQMIGASHHVFVVPQGSLVQGFAVVSLELGPTIGELQFLGVEEGNRRQGIGERLLRAASAWLFNQAGAEEISLNVNEDLIGARRLYERVGFRLLYSGISLQKLLPRALEI